MDIIKFAKEWDRMCKTCSECSHCPIWQLGDEEIILSCDCATMFRKYPEKVISIVKKWAEEHPAKTRQSEFLKMHPNAKLFNGYIDICPKKIDTTLEDSINCNITSCNECKRRSWSKEVE